MPSSYRMHMSERDITLLYAAMYVYAERESRMNGRRDTEVDALLERLELLHDNPNRASLAAYDRLAERAAKERA